MWYLLASSENDSDYFCLTSWETGVYCGQVNSCALLNNWIFYKAHLFQIYLLHQNTWIPRRSNLFLFISVTIAWVKSVPCENNLFIENRSTNVHSMETWQKRISILQNTLYWMLESEITKLVFKNFHLKIFENIVVDIQINFLYFIFKNSHLYKHLCNTKPVTKPSIHFKVWIYLSGFKRHEIQELVKMVALIITTPLNFKSLNRYLHHQNVVYDHFTHKKYFWSISFFGLIFFKQIDQPLFSLKPSEKCRHSRKYRTL